MAEYQVLDTLDMGNKVYAAGDTVGIDDAALATRLIDLGVIEGEAPDDASESAAKLAKLSKAELIELAQSAGLISVSETMTKADIIEAIEAAATAQTGGE